MLEENKRHVVKIILKSGHATTISCDDFSVTTSPIDGRLKGIEWNNASPSILHIELDEIAAVYQVFGADVEPAPISEKES